MAVPEQWPATIDELTLLKSKGKGYFGEVWQCRWDNAPSASHQLFALKKVPLSLIRQNSLMEQMEREIQIQRELRHPHIVQLFFDFRDESFAYLGMELAEGVLFDKLTQAGRFPAAAAAQYFYEVCDALEYLHGRKVVHRDIKPENILLDTDGRVKLADFGWSNLISNSAALRQTFCGTPEYLAPEMIRGQGHNESLDMWEVGVLLYEMVIGRSPFGAPSQETTCKLILKVDLRFPSDMDADAQDLVTALCKLAPEERLTAKQAKQHTFVTKHQGAATESVGRPSIMARMLRHDKEKLQGELARILQAKCSTEQDLLQVSQDLEQVHERLKKEQRLTETAQQRHALLKEREEQQLQELEQLRKTTEGLAADIRARRSGAGGD